MLLDLTNGLRSKINNPERQLLSEGLLPRSVVVERESILSMYQMSRHIVVLHCPEALYVSNVYNQDINIMADEFTAIKMLRSHEGIYYDIRLVLGCASVDAGQPDIIKSTGASVETEEPATCRGQCVVCASDARFVSAGCRAACQGVNGNGHIRVFRDSSQYGHCPYARTEGLPSA